MHLREARMTISERCPVHGDGMMVERVFGSLTWWTCPECVRAGREYRAGGKPELVLRFADEADRDGLVSALRSVLTFDCEPDGALLVLGYEEYPDPDWRDID